MYHTVGCDSVQGQPVSAIVKSSPRAEIWPSARMSAYETCIHRYCRLMLSEG